ALAGDAAYGREAPRLARCFDCLTHHRDVPRRLDRVIRAEADGLGTDPVDGVVGGDARIRRAVAAGLCGPVLGQVDRDDPPGAGESGSDHGTEADEPRSEDYDRGTGLDLRGVQRRADPRGEPTRERSAALEGRLRVDLRERDLRHYRVFGERRS